MHDFSPGEVKRVMLQHTGVIWCYIGSIYLLDALDYFRTLTTSNRELGDYMDK